MSQTSPLTLFIQKPWNALQKGLLPRRGQWAITYGWLTFFPNQLTFGLEITGQTNEFNELSRRQWPPLAIWTPIKGYGQVSQPFQEVCTQMWQNALASVSALTSCSKCWGCHVIVPSSAALPADTPIFVAHFVSDALSPNSPTSTKAEECKPFSFSFSGVWVIVASFFSATNVTPLWSNKRERRYCGNKQSRSAAKNNFWRRLATPPSFSPLWFSDPPLFPSPYSLSRCAYCHFRLSKFSFSKLRCVQLVFAAG